MSETKVPEMSSEDKAHLETLERDGPASYGVGLYSAAQKRFESLALENARLKAELATAQANYRAVEMLNAANRRLTALIDATEEETRG